MVQQDIQPGQGLLGKWPFDATSATYTPAAANYEVCMHMRVITGKEGAG